MCGGFMGEKNKRKWVGKSKSRQKQVKLRYKSYPRQGPDGHFLLEFLLVISTKNYLYVRSLDSSAFTQNWLLLLTTFVLIALLILVI